MTAAEWLEQLVAVLPDDDSTVTLSRKAIRARLDGAPAGVLKDRHLSVEEVAEAMGRRPSTVRGWLIRKELIGYKLNHRDWRVRPEDLEAYREGQARGGVEEPESGPVNMREWREIKSGERR